MYAINKTNMLKPFDRLTLLPSQSCRKNYLWTHGFNFCGSKADVTKLIPSILKLGQQPIWQDPLVHTARLHSCLLLQSHQQSGYQTALSAVYHTHNLTPLTPAHPFLPWLKKKSGVCINNTPLQKVGIRDFPLLLVFFKKP